MPLGSFGGVQRWPSMLGLLLDMVKNDCFPLSSSAQAGCLRRSSAWQFRAPFGHSLGAAAFSDADVATQVAYLRTGWTEHGRWAAFTVARCLSTLLQTDRAVERAVTVGVDAELVVQSRHSSMPRERMTEGDDGLSLLRMFSGDASLKASEEALRT
jgi:hypothetical protein